MLVFEKQSVLILQLYVLLLNPYSSTLHCKLVRFFYSVSLIEFFSGVTMLMLSLPKIVFWEVLPDPLTQIAGQADKISGTVAKKSGLKIVFYHCVKYGFIRSKKFQHHIWFILH